jgi:DNA-binding response OmpR family regulator
MVEDDAAAGTVTDTLRKDADEFLEKPVRPDRLIAVATALISKARGDQVGRPDRDPGLRTERP